MPAVLRRPVARRGAGPSGSRKNGISCCWPNTPISRGSANGILWWQILYRSPRWSRQLAMSVSAISARTMSRGCDTMIEVGRELRRADGALKLEVIGEAHDAEARQSLQSAAAAGDLTWLGFLRSEEALARVAGSLAGCAC